MQTPPSTTTLLTASTTATDKPMDVASPASTSEASLPLRPAANNNKNTTNTTKSEALPAAPAKEVKSVEIYTATYSGTQVFEMSVGDVDIMRRRSDSYLNATQLLKLSGCEKGKRTKILEREVLTGNHEKIQGGYGKYQGTWVPLEIGRELAQRYQVLDKVLPLIEFDTNTWDDLPEKQAIPAKMMLPSSKAKKFTLADIDSPPPSSPCPTASPLWDSQDTFDPQTPLLAFLSQTDSQDMPPPNTPKRKNEHDNDDDATSEKKRPKKSSDTKKKYTPSDKSQELLSSISTVQKMVEAMDLDFYSKLSTRQDEIAALQAQNARLTRQFELERKEWDQTRYVGMEQLKRAQTRIHQLEESVQRANLKDVDVGNFAIDWHAMDPSSSSSSSSASSSSASGLPPHPSSSSSSASSNMSSAATAAYLSKKKRRADEYLERQVQELRSRLHQSNLKAQQRANTLEERLAKSQETEAQCKRLIASCCNLPLNKIDDLIGPLTTAIENDPPDMDFARVIGFMERLRQHQQ